MSSTEGLLKGRTFHFTASEREALEARLSLSTDQLLRCLVREVRQFALVPISGFQVGSAGLTSSGDVYLGVNLEFSGTSFAQTVHSEQFLISLSRTHSAHRLVKVAVSAPPCGHCRQFAAEFDPDGELELLIGDEETVTLKSLLPRAFTPADLEVNEAFYGTPLSVPEEVSLEEAARRAASCAYAPYSGAGAGVALRASDGRLFTGAALENAAYNPGLPPFQAAFISAYAHRCAPEDLIEAVLCQKPGAGIDYEAQSRELAGRVSFHGVKLRSVRS